MEQKKKKYKIIHESEVAALAAAKLEALGYSIGALTNPKYHEELKAVLPISGRSLRSIIIKGGFRAKALKEKMQALGEWLGGRILL